jgi:hypothetical protein
MATDLTTVHDHPATLLFKWAEGQHTAERHDAVESMAYCLESYQEEREVTFAALDNDALAAVREAYLGYSTTSRFDSGRKASYADDLASAINGLLGLDES